MTARRARRSWLNRNLAALVSLVVTIPLAGWWTTRSDYKAWYDAEPRDAVTVAAGGTSFADATWYAASVEVDPQPVHSTSRPEPPPEGTTRVRVYFRIQVDDVAKLEGLAGCRAHLRTPDGRMWSESNLESSYQDRPTGCAGGDDSKLQPWRPKNLAPYYLKPTAGKPFETVAVFIVPTAVAESAQPAITWQTRLPKYLSFPR